MDDAHSNNSRYYPMRMGEIKRLGCAGWVTETGSGDLDIADEYALSWMHWDYKLFGNKTWDSSGLFKTSGPYDKVLCARHRGRSRPLLLHTSPHMPARLRVSLEASLVQIDTT